MPTNMDASTFQDNRRHGALEKAYREIRSLTKAMEGALRKGHASRFNELAEKRMRILRCICRNPRDRDASQSFLKTIQTHNKRLMELAEEQMQTMRKDLDTAMRRRNVQANLSRAYVHSITQAHFVSRKG